MKTGLLLAGLRINFNQRAPLAGFITPCVAFWDRSGLILSSGGWKNIAINNVFTTGNPFLGQNYLEIV